MHRKCKAAFCLVKLVEKTTYLNIQNRVFFRSLYATKSFDTSNKINIPDIPPKPFKEHETDVWIGPPNPVSNLRLKVFPDSPNLSQEERDFYTRSAEVQDWNQEYWAAHNRDFAESKKLYVARLSKEKNLPKEETLSPEEMSIFYKDFLDKNRTKHISYNWSWYRKNVGLIFLSAKIKITKCREFIASSVKFKS